MELDLLSPNTIEVSEPIENLFAVLSRKLSRGRSSGIAFITDDKKSVLGVVTDADLRRFILNMRRLPETIQEITRFDFLSLKANDVELLTNPSDLLKVLSQRGWSTDFPVRYVPIINSVGQLSGIVDTLDYAQAFSTVRDVVAVVGLGYVGLTTAAAFVSVGREVLGIDRNISLLDAIRSRSVFLSEPGVHDVLFARLGDNFNISENLISLNKRDGGSRLFHLICLPTPLSNDKKQLDVSLIEDYIEKNHESIQQGDVIVMRSTVPVGFGDTLVRSIEVARGWKIGFDFHYVAAPERTVEGNALEEIFNLPQLLGGSTKSCLALGRLLFESVSREIVPCSSTAIAEATKIAGNSYRDYSFAFANYLATFCREHQIDVDEVIERSNFGYTRSRIPSPSPGVGGSCLTKDPYLLRSKEPSIPSPIVAARLFNSNVPEELAKFIRERVTDISSREFVAIGIAFKGQPATDDVRDSTGLEIALFLRSDCKSMVFFDAVVEGKLLGEQVHKLNETGRFSPEGILLLNNHPDNREIAMALAANSASHLVVFDPWRILDTAALSAIRSKRPITVLTMSSEYQLKATSDSKE